MNKGYIWALGFFVLGFICTMFLDGGKQLCLALVSFIASAVIAMCVHEDGKRNKR